MLEGKCVSVRVISREYKTKQNESTSQLGLTKTTIPELGGLLSYAAFLPIKRRAVARWKASREEVLILI